MFQDKVFIEKLAATAITGKDAWNRPTPQPIRVSVDLNTNFRTASATDNLKYSLNYAVISRNILEYLKAKEHYNFKSLANIAESISGVLFSSQNHTNFQAQITVESDKSEIRADSVEYVCSRDVSGPLSGTLDLYRVKGLKLLTIIGVFTFERLKRQIVDIDLDLTIKRDSSIYVHEIIDAVVLYVESANFKTVETLVMKIGQLVSERHPGVSSVHARVKKPNAITYTEGVGVESDMCLADFKDAEPIVAADDSVHSAIISGQDAEFSLPVEDIDVVKFNKHVNHTAYIAFGSNVGNPVQNINLAIKLLEDSQIKVLATLSLYISKAMYVTDQPDFYNGVLKIQFLGFTPKELLDLLKKIEYRDFKRVKEYENGPRIIDLDIILVDDLILSSPELNIPHISMLERTFVLQPLCELIPPDEIHPVSAEPLHNHLKQLLQSKPDEDVQVSSELVQLVPLPRVPDRENLLKFDQLGHSSRTLIMGVLNVTPDSFSDGGSNYDKPVDEVCENALKLILDGANILDIGGVSTRPGSVEPSEEEELDRLIPVIEAIRASSNPQLSKCIISVDTYRPQVARKCLESGADIINDVMMGMYDEEIFKVVAEFGCPYIMNHTRGTAETMLSLTTYRSNTNEDIIEYVTDSTQEYVEPKVGEVLNLTRGISRELSLQLKKAYGVGVKKWQIILDPGVGFAKNMHQNIAIIRNASFFKKYSVLINQRENDHDQDISHSYISFNGLPTLIGTSRKRFIGTITEKPVASDRVIGTAATAVACIEQHTDILRVHDVAEIKAACQMGDAIYRGIVPEEGK